MPPITWEMLLGQTGVLVLLGYIANLLWASHKDADVAKEVQHKRELDDKDRQITFIDGLRKEAIADKKATEERIASQTEAMKELAGVVRESVEVTNLVLNRESREPSYPKPTTTRGRNRG
jgi:hypothetical protein